ncbi:MAG: hypothetical protein M3P14_00020 [Chloroflexota bacterium]|nr:hypothetical protein [Chloroflexota bacterium]
MSPRLSKIPEIAYYLFNFSNGHGVWGRTLREQVAALLRAKMWGVNVGEPHRAALATGDRVLIYIGPPEGEFVGRGVLASAVRDWTPAEAQGYPGDTQGGVLLADVEEWDPPVLMQTVVLRIDPTGSNPYVQANARNGFQHGVVLITDQEYEAVLAVRAETSSSTV